jgi:exonuclease VII large subunit
MMGAPACLATQRSRLGVWRQTLPLTARATVVAPARTTLRQLRHHIHQLSCDMVRRTGSRLHQLHAHIDAASPDRYFALGLSYVTRADGSLVRSRAQVVDGDRVQIHLADGLVPAMITKEESHDT